MQPLQLEIYSLVQQTLQLSGLAFAGSLAPPLPSPNSPLPFPSLILLSPPSSSHSPSFLPSPHPRLLPLLTFIRLMTRNTSFHIPRGGLRTPRPKNIVHGERARSVSLLSHIPLRVCWGGRGPYGGGDYRGWGLVIRSRGDQWLVRLVASSSCICGIGCLDLVHRTTVPVGIGHTSLGRGSIRHGLDSRRGYGGLRSSPHSGYGIASYSDSRTWVFGVCQSSRISSERGGDLRAL